MDAVEKVGPHKPSSERSSRAAHDRTGRRSRLVKSIAVRVGPLLAGRSREFLPNTSVARKGAATGGIRRVRTPPPKKMWTDHPNFFDDDCDYRYVTQCTKLGIASVFCYVLWNWTPQLLKRGCALGGSCRAIDRLCVCLCPNKMTSDVNSRHGGSSCQAIYLYFRFVTNAHISQSSRS